MNKAIRLVIQVGLYVGFAVAVGWFSASPAYQYAADDMTTLKLSLSHAAHRVKPCVQLTPKEIAAELAIHKSSVSRHIKRGKREAGIEAIGTSV